MDEGIFIEKDELNCENGKASILNPVAAATAGGSSGTQNFNGDDKMKVTMEDEATNVNEDGKNLASGEVSLFYIYIFILLYLFNMFVHFFFSLSKFSINEVY